MPPQTGAALLERSATDRELAGPSRVAVDVPGETPARSVPAPRAAAEARAEAGTGARAGAGAATTAEAPAGSSRRLLPRRPSGRGVPRPPGRRGHLWLAAMVVGAVLAAFPGTLGDSATDASVSAADYGLGAASDLGLDGDMDDAGVRRVITEAEAQARLNELAASRAARTPTTALPTQGRLTTCFCMRWGSMHYGLDLAAPLGTPIVSASDGVVIRAGRASGYGNAVYIQDADGNVHIYGHMRYYEVEAGQVVHAGDLIASVGNEGFSTGPHLHYEIHRGGIDGRPIDPEAWLAERGVYI